MRSTSPPFRIQFENRNCDSTELTINAKDLRHVVVARVRQRYGHRIQILPEQQLQFRRRASLSQPYQRITIRQNKRQSANPAATAHCIASANRHRGVVALSLRKTASTVQAGKGCIGMKSRVECCGFRGVEYVGFILRWVLAALFVGGWGGGGGRGYFAHVLHLFPVLYTTGYDIFLQWIYFQCTQHLRMIIFFPEFLLWFFLTQVAFRQNLQNFKAK